jgi:uncharacterized membrane protein required for colicin V production
MSFIDLIAILLIICLCYIGYSKGFKGKSFFLSSFALSAFLLYFLFDPFFSTITKIIPNLIIASVVVIGIVFIPFFVLTEFILRKTLNGEKPKHFYQSKKDISPFSRLCGSLVGFIGGYAFVYALISIAVINSKDPISMEIPSFIQKSFFYKIALNKKLASQNIAIKADNLQTLSFLYSPDIIKKYSLSKEETVVILKIIKGISNKEANNLLKKYQEKSSIEQVFASLKEVYLNEINIFEDKYKSDSAEVEIIFDRLTKAPNKPKTKKSSTNLTITEYNFE